MALQDPSAIEIKQKQVSNSLTFRNIFFSSTNGLSHLLLYSHLLQIFFSNGELFSWYPYDFQPCNFFLTFIYIQVASKVTACDSLAISLSLKVGDMKSVQIVFRCKCMNIKKKNLEGHKIEILAHFCFTIKLFLWQSMLQDLFFNFH